MDAEALRGRIAGAERWEHRADGWWLVEPALDVRLVASVMVEAGARLSTLTARPIVPPAPEQDALGYFLYYHWDLDGQMLTVGAVVRESVPSIGDLCPAADWVEREIHDYFGIRFVGREILPPLVTREGDPPVFGATSRNGKANGAERAGGRA